LLTTVEARRFIWRNIITHFGIPRAIIFDNGRQFDTTKLTDYLDSLGYHAWFTTVAHPQTNGQAEIANKSILHGLKKKLDDAKGKWGMNCTGSYAPSEPLRKLPLVRLSSCWPIG